MTFPLAIHISGDDIMLEFGRLTPEEFQQITPTFLDEIFQACRDDNKRAADLNEGDAHGR